MVAFVSITSSELFQCLLRAKGMAKYLHLNAAALVVLNSTIHGQVPSFKRSCSRGSQLHNSSKWGCQFWI